MAPVATKAVELLLCVCADRTAGLAAGYVHRRDTETAYGLPFGVGTFALPRHPEIAHAALTGRTSEVPTETMIRGHHCIDHYLRCNEQKLVTLGLFEMTLGDQ